VLLDRLHKLLLLPTLDTLPTGFADMAAAAAGQAAAACWALASNPAGRPWAEQVSQGAPRRGWPGLRAALPPPQLLLPGLQLPAGRCCSPPAGACPPPARLTPRPRPRPASPPTPPRRL
jgi:hypothetical protein